MNNRFLILTLIPLLLLATILPIQNRIPQAHAQGGTVCITETTATTCPVVLPTFNGPVTTPVSTQLLVAVRIQDSGPFNGFDITLKADIAILKPHDADLTSTVVNGPVVLAKCIGGVLVAGSTCAPTDTPDTIRFAVIGLGGLTTFPGLLFTAIYNITGTTPIAGTTIGYQTGCTLTSVPPDTCVLISDGTVTPVPETAQTGGFNNNTPPPFVTLTTNPTIIGPIFPGDLSTTSTVTATPQNGFDMSTNTFVTLTSIVKGPSGLSGSVSPNVHDLSGGAQTSTLTVSATTTVAPGNYNVTVLGTYQVEDPVTFVVTTLAQPLGLPITVVNYDIARSPTSLNINLPQTSAQATVTVTSLNNFGGNVILDTTVPSSATGVTASYNPATITGPGSSTLTITVTASTPDGTYTITIKSNSTLSGFTRTKTTTITLTVVAEVHDVAINSFTVNTNQGTVGTQVTFTITVQNKGNQPEIVTVNALAGNVTVAAQNVTIAAGASQTVTLTWNTVGYAAGTYQLGAKVIQVSGETITADNTQSSGTFALAAPAPGLDSTLLTILAVIVILVVVGLILLLRRRRTPQTQ